MQWCLTENPDKRLVRDLVEQINVPPIIANILVRRGIDTYGLAKQFFRPDWDDLYDPFLMADMDKAVDRILHALETKEHIFIYGDYDVDGITSVSLLYLFLRDVGGSVHYYIPNRMNDGYGLSEAGIKQAVKKEATLLITVDCGITAIDEVALAKSQGIDVIVSDHHEPHDTLPDALAILDPKREDCPYPFKLLAGVGVAFKLIQAISKKLELAENLYHDFTDLVALGSAADIVPLVDENRILVSKGLEKINRMDRVGLFALAESSNLEGRKIGTGQLVFIMAPRINAVGRLGNAERAVELLITQDHEEARKISRVLEKENQNRKSIDEETFQEAIEMVGECYDEEKDCAVVLSKDGWHPGVIGIVASRVVEQIYRPTILIGIEDGMGKGSARSIPDFDLYSALKTCESYLSGFGGHKYAAGLTIDPDKIDSFSRAFRQVANEMMEEEYKIQKIWIDGEIELPEITDKFVRLLNLFAPFGPQNMRPLFVSRNLQVIGSPRVVGKNHLKFRVRQGGVIFDVIGFNLGEKLYRLSPGENNLDMVYVIEENFWNGQVKTQLRVKDLR